MPKRYPPEFRRRVLELLKAGKSVTEVAVDLGLSTQTIYNRVRRRSITGAARGRSLLVFVWE
jgi:transposase-like protein